ncbi:MAG TPA: hypothetical protein VGE07_02645 [Herpetosiphonaceae bacterium]
MGSNRMLPLLLVGLLLVVAIGGAYYFLNQTPPSGVDPNNPDNALNTPIPPPPVQILQAVSDIPANQLITPGDYESLFEVVPVDQSSVTPDDVLVADFNTLVAGKVTTVDINGGDRIKVSLFREAGIAEQIPTAVPGQGTRKAMTIYVPDLGEILQAGNNVDVLSSYRIEMPYLRWSGTADNNVITLVDEKYLDISTKVIAQNIPVLAVTAPPQGTVDANGQPLPPPAPTPTPDPNLPTPLPGTEPEPAPPVFAVGALWTVVVAVTDQEAELIKYSMDRDDSTLSLIVRRADDPDTVTTTGVTMDLLGRLYNVPMVYAQPNVIVDPVRGFAPPLPPNQPPVVLQLPLPFGGANPVPLPTAIPSPTPAP